MDNINISNIKFGNQFGYAEFFEWEKFTPEMQGEHLCRLVQFSPDNPNKIRYARDTNNLIGVTTISSGYLTNNPQDWPYKYYISPYGDLCLEKKEIAVANKEYDELNELAYIATYKSEIYVPAVNAIYKNDTQYIPRGSRAEWVQVIMMGQCILRDNGECKPGEYCTLYKGDDPTLFGTVVPATPFDSLKIYILQRLYTNSIICLLKNI